MLKNIRLIFILVIATALLIACGAEPAPTPYPGEVSWDTAGVGEIGRAHV